MKAPALLTVLLLAVFESGFAQFEDIEDDGPRKSPNTLIYLELGGATGLFSANADFLMAENLYFRLGSSFIPTDEYQPVIESNNRNLPVSLVLGLYKQTPLRKAFIEYGAAVVVGPPVETPLFFSPPAVVILFGIRWDNPESETPLFGLSLNPAFSGNGVAIIPGIKIGFRL